MKPKPPRVTYPVRPVALTRVGHTEWAVSEVTFNVSSRGWLHATVKATNATTGATREFVSPLPLVNTLPPWLDELIDDVRTRLPEAKYEGDTP